MTARSIAEMLRDLRPIAGGAEDPQDPDDSDKDADKSGKGDDGKDHKAEAEKWKALARKHESQAKANADAAKKLKDLEDADKSESEKAAAKVADAEKRAQEAELKALRLEVAATKGLTPAQAKRLVGTTQEELEADADELLETFKPTDDGKGAPLGKPREHLRGGGDPTEDPEEMDPRKLAEAVPRD